MGRIRWGVALALLLSPLACARPAPVVVPAPAARPPPSSAAATAAAAQPPGRAPAPAAAAVASPPVVAGPERLSRALAPKGHGDAVLLLGLHLEAIEGYTPMFSSEGKPRTNTRPGYRTLVVRTRGGTAEVVGELPFVAVPQAEGFVFLGEATVSVHLPTDPNVTLHDGSPKPRNYDATEIWRASNPARAAAAEAALVGQLARKKAWGVESTAQIVYVTRRALCTARTESEVTGGALYFYASSVLSLSGLGTGDPPRSVFGHVDEPTFRRFASTLLEIDPADIEIDRPRIYNSFDLIVWQDDVMACLDHARGAVQLTGAVRVSANSARSFMQAGLVGPAATSLAPDHETPDFDAIVAAVPEATDAFVAPAHDVVLVEVAREKKPRDLVVWDVTAGRAVATLTIPGRPIMDEWASGEAAERWLKVLRPHLRKPTTVAPRR